MRLIQLLRNLQIDDRAMLEDYYCSAYAIVRAASSSCFVIVAPREYELDGSEWQTFMTNESYTGVMQEVHRYFLALSSHSCTSGVKRRAGQMLGT